MSKTKDSALWLEDKRHQVLDSLNAMKLVDSRGRVFKVLGPMIEATGLQHSIGEACDIHATSGDIIQAEIVGFREDKTLMMPVGATRGIAPGDAISAHGYVPSVQVSEHLLGHVIDAMGNPMDTHDFVPKGESYPLYGKKLNPLQRHIIDTSMDLGVKLMDTCLPMGRGQRMGLFAGPGVGKSMLMGMLARNSDADINVIALVGERNREVREFLDDALGEGALEKTIVVVATSDMPPVLRVRSALLATTIAEVFREQGKQVLLMMDSLTRFAQAQREIGLMLGEPPASKGYTPSCFTTMAELLERAGPGEKNGHISAFYTVLVEGEDLSADPVAESAMAVLDGHVVLERKYAERGHYPAINLLRSISRLENKLSSKTVLQAARSLRKDIAMYERMEDMIQMGAYEQGSNASLDAIISNMPQINEFLQQETEQVFSREYAEKALLSLVNKEVKSESIVPNNGGFNQVMAES
ncbi:MAG: FliI/YscN family ATPase [Ghiorsea sp.]